MKAWARKNPREIADLWNKSRKLALPGPVFLLRLDFNLRQLLSADNPNRHIVYDDDYPVSSPPISFAYSPEELVKNLGEIDAQIVKFVLDLPIEVKERIVDNLKKLPAAEEQPVILNLSSSTKSGFHLRTCSIQCRLKAASLNFLPVHWPINTRAPRQ